MTVSPSAKTGAASLFVLVLASRITTLLRMTNGINAATAAFCCRWSYWTPSGTAERGVSVSKHDLTHARHDPVHCLAPGLFRSLKRGERKHSKLDVAYDYGNGKRIEFSGPEPLGADDLRILQGLVAMAGPSGLMLSPDPQTEAGRQLRLFLEPKWEAVQQNAMVVKGSYRSLAREVGYADIDNTRPVRDCIERLWKVSIIAQNDRKRQGFRLLSEYASDEQDGKLYVALNPLIARAIMGGQHIRIDMAEVRKLRTDPARLIHQRLCGWIDLGKSGRIQLDTLCGYVWPDEPTNPNTVKKRRQTARKALAELAAVGWRVGEYAKGKWEIGRPKASDCNAAAPCLTAPHPLFNSTQSPV
ncbi:hypothetical protein PAJ_2132 [Pantoea ananatis AJ13355]|uniref:RepC n=1 Tax=Pantoea ananatis (strain AJ13355) TaxID=932677 RepID=A0A0H3L2X8_PANAA|nr:hypothetical protein PAJ_2132 [Pantoea ananatis AJ13355]